MGSTPAPKPFAKTCRKDHGPKRINYADSEYRRWLVRLRQRHLQREADQERKSKFHCCQVIRRHRITSSARSRIDRGMVMPSALAVFKLIASKILEGRSSGRSPALAPLGAFWSRPDLPTA